MQFKFVTELFSNPNKTKANHSKYNYEGWLLPGFCLVSFLDLVSRIHYVHLCERWGRRRARRTALRGWRHCSSVDCQRDIRRLQRPQVSQSSDELSSWSSARWWQVVSTGGRLGEHDIQRGLSERYSLSCALTCFLNSPWKPFVAPLFRRKQVIQITQSNFDAWFSGKHCLADISHFKEHLTK